MELSNPIAQGRTAEVYPWEGKSVLKLYFSWCPRHWIEQEQYAANAVRAAGIPTPAVYDAIAVNDRHGLIFERVAGRSMLAEMGAHPWRLFELARALARLQSQIHELSFPNLPSYREGTHYAIQHAPHLPEPTRQKALADLDGLWDGNRVCHGDFHPGNVLLTEHGPVVIDWMTVKSGDPWADVARTSLILSVGIRGAGKLVNPVVRWASRFYYQAYLAAYKKIHPDTEHRLERWLPVMAAARLNEDIPQERDALLQIAGASQATDLEIQEDRKQ